MARLRRKASEAETSEVEGPPAKYTLTQMVWGWRFGTPAEKQDILNAMRPEVIAAAGRLGARSPTETRVTLELLEAACRAELEALEDSREQDVTGGLRDTDPRPPAA